MPGNGAVLKWSLESVAEHRSRSTREWEDARRKAFLHDALGVLARRPVDLLPFEEIRQELHLHNSHLVGIRGVPLDQIIGSTDRYADFTREFLPRHRFLERRWKRVDGLVHGRAGIGPVELYRVGEIYFVRDGNHRVSVARQHKDASIRAHVWRSDVRVLLGPDTNLGDLLCQAARSAFLEETNADRLCPHVDLDLTRPDGYEFLAYEIYGFREAISKIDGREVSMDEAVRLWCDMAYMPVAEIVRQQGILRRFPGCTETDLYLWMRRNQEELEIRYGRGILMAEAAEDLMARFGHRPSRARRMRRRVGRLAESVGDFRARLAGRDAPSPGDNEVNRVSSVQLLASVCEQANRTPRMRFGVEGLADWSEWRAILGERVWDILGVGSRPWRQHSSTDLDAHVEDVALIDAVRREEVWLRAEDSLRVPVYVFAPLHVEGPHPAIAVFPGHGTIAQTAAAKVSQAQPNAIALAEAGFVVLAMELRGDGLLDAADHLQIDRAARVVGRTWLGLVVHDALRAIDLLTRRADVDADRIGAVGVGPGGGLALYLAAIDDRLGAVIVGGYLAKYGLACSGAGYCRCGDLPGILPEAEMSDVAARIAPRPALYINDARDPTTPPDAASDNYAVAQRVYRTLGVPNRIRLLEQPDANDAFANELAVAWFGRWLRR